MRIWDSYLGEAERAAFAKARFGRRMGFGKRPCIVAIDCQKYMVGEDGPGDADWPSSCGAVGRAALAAGVHVVEAAQARDIPVFFTLFEMDPSGNDAGAYGRKRGVLQSERWCLAGSFGAQLVDDLRPGANDIVFVKKKPSAFHGTPLLGYLVDRGVDTVIIIGGATSNCVRASVFDASSSNFSTIVVEEAVFDRMPVSHAISLFDMDRQFADVVSLEETLRYLDEVERPK